MFDFASAPVDIRSDIGDVFRLFWDVLARPGATLTGTQRVAIASAVRDPQGQSGVASHGLREFAIKLYVDPATIREEDVRRPADVDGDASTVETIAIVSMLAAVDAFHHAVGIDIPALPEPVAGDPTGDVTEGLKRRRTHVPVPPGPIPFTLDLVPSDARVYLALHGPLYMTGDEMDRDDFERTPGLNRAQMELVSSRLSFHNECFY